MKLITVLFLLLSMEVSAKGFAQESLNLKFKNVEISTILNTIEKQTDYRFLYESNLEGLNKKTSLSVVDASLKHVLDILFENTDLTFKITDTKLVIIQQSGEAQSANLLNNIITGKVTDENGIPLPGVSVQLKSKNKGTITNTQGIFSVNASGDDMLVFSSVGYGTQEISVSGKSEINIILVASKKELDQVVVIGYGTQKKRDLTGSISVVKGEDIAKMPSTNPIASLQGRVAGLTIVNSGRAGAAPTVRIRGVNSTNNADPLYVVDGILQTNIDYINQADIETIEVLKDPSSEAIYGLQGGNGVIIITTKRAPKGQTTISFQSSVGIQKVVHKIAVANADQFKQLYAQQITNVNGKDFDFSRYDSAGGNTNWQNEIFRPAVIASNSLSVSNSTEKSTTYLNIGYSTQEGVEKFDKYEKYNVRLNEEIRVSKNFKMGGEFDGLYFKQNPSVGGIENEALWAAPIVPVQTGTGVYYTMPSFQRAQVANPVAIINEANGHTLNSGYRFTGNVFAEIKFLQHFTWKSTFYTDLGFNQSRGYTPLPYTYINLGEGTNATTTFTDTTAHTAINQSTAQYKTYQQDHTLTFDKLFTGGHHIVALAGFSTLYHYNEFINGNRTDTSLLVIPNDPIFWYLNIAQSSNPGNFSGGAEEDASISFMGRINYSFNNRYLLNVTYRRDGTSKFSPTNQWGNFKSVGAGWVVSDEKFLQTSKWIDFLKLKASWGTVGNGLNVGNYLSYPKLNNGNAGIFGQNIYPAVIPAYIPDPNLHWERVEGKDAGFELRAMQNRLSLDVDFYDRKTHDILTFITVPNQTEQYFTNLGTIDNKGLEITAGYSGDISKDFSYSINGNFSVNKNKVVSIGNDFNFSLISVSNGQTINTTSSGNSIGAFYGYEQTGVYQNEKDALNAPYYPGGFLPGDISYHDADGNDTLDTRDIKYLGTPFPKYNYGLSFSFAYKGFDLAIDGQGVAGNKIFLERRTQTFAPLNYETNRLNAWHGKGTSNTEPALNPTRLTNNFFSDYWLENGGYFRLRTLQLGYNFNANTLKNIGIKKLRLYISGQNIFTLTNASGYSPEVPVDNPISAGHDNGVYPVPAIYSIGLNAIF